MSGETAVVAYEPPPARRGGLGRRQRRVLRSVAECLFSDGDRPVPVDRLDWLMDDLSDFVSATAGTTRLAVRASTFVLQFSPIWVLRRPRRLTSLPVERRLECLRRVESSRTVLLPLLFAVAKIMLAMIYYEHPDALVETGYDGECLEGPNPAAGLP